MLEIIDQIYDNTASCKAKFKKMTSISRTALLPYTAQQVFDLVNDIESYPSYMQGCSQARVLSRGDNWVEAELVLAQGNLRQRFSTRNTLIVPERIDMQLLEGPFSKFEGVWQFKCLQGEACKVSLDLNFKLNNKLVNLAAGRLFESVGSRLVDEVSLRAKQCFGGIA